MRLKLSNSFFTSKILNAPTDKLASNSALKDYFRGLYFKVEKTSAGENMASINFAKGVVRLYYKEDLSTTTNGVTTVKKSKQNVRS